MYARAVGLLPIQSLFFHPRQNNRSLSGGTPTAGQDTSVTSLTAFILSWSLRLKNTFRTLARYPAAIVGLTIILVLCVISIYHHHRLSV